MKNEFLKPIENLKPYKINGARVKSTLNNNKYCECNSVFDNFVFSVQYRH